MRRLLVTLFVTASLGAASSASASHQCSVRAIAGQWVFATGIGKQALPTLPPNKDITAIGTMNIYRDGTIEGVFDATVQDAAFLASVTYTGSIVVDSDCRATLTFATSEDSIRTDSVVIVDRSEMIGMSQDPANLWTYQIRRVNGARSRRFNTR